MSNASGPDQPRPDPSNLFDEYKIIQDKIDKIGAFKFIIRGWAITVASAGLAVTMTAKILPSYSVVFIPVFILFWAIEHSELRIRRVLAARALRIERALGVDTPRVASIIVEDTFVKRPLATNIAAVVSKMFYFEIIALLVAAALMHWSL